MSSPDGSIPLNSGPRTTSDTAGLPTYSLCIATLNRRDALLRTLAYAARQTCLPQQIVVVDVSDDWQETRAEAIRVLEPWPGIALDYVTSSIRSSATQRNEGIALCRHDIVFLIDDDSFLHPTCAEEILKVYAADTGKEVAGVGARLVPQLPTATRDGDEPMDGARPLARKPSGRRGLGTILARAQKTGFGRWFNRKVLLQSVHELFICYDEPRDRSVPDALTGLDVTPVTFLPGCGMSLRRQVALDEPFDHALRYYAAFEDLDVGYRAARHGTLLRADRAYMHHYEVAGGRVKRKKLVIFQLLNMLVFLKRHAEDPDRFVPVYRQLLRRRLLGEALKDLLSGRLDLPQMRGVITVMRIWPEVWNRDTTELDTWYPELQAKILARI
jgi:glycosyltransferase involved in cell wall biosynthesis